MLFLVPAQSLNIYPIYTDRQLTSSRNSLIGTVILTLALIDMTVIWHRILNGSTANLHGMLRMKDANLTLPSLTPCMFSYVFHYYNYFCATPLVLGINKYQWLFVVRASVSVLISGTFGGLTILWTPYLATHVNLKLNNKVTDPTSPAMRVHSWNTFCIGATLELMCCCTLVRKVGLLCDINLFHRNLHNFHTSWPAIKLKVKPNE